LIPRSGNNYFLLLIFVDHFFEAADCLVMVRVLHSFFHRHLLVWPLLPVFQTGSTEPDEVNEGFSLILLFGFQRDILSLVEGWAFVFAESLTFGQFDGRIWFEGELADFNLR